VGRVFRTRVKRKGSSFLLRNQTACRRTGTEKDFVAGNKPTLKVKKPGGELREKSTKAYIGMSVKCGSSGIKTFCGKGDEKIDILRQRSKQK